MVPRSLDGVGNFFIGCGEEKTGKAAASFLPLCQRLPEEALEPQRGQDHCALRQKKRNIYKNRINSPFFPCYLDIHYVILSTVYFM